MEKFLEITYLYDFYQALLTDKQRDLLSGYYFDDLSLGELALQYQISRQSVFDAIKKSEQKLLDYESKLKLWEKYQRQEKILGAIKATIESLDKIKQTEEYDALKALIDQLNSEI